MGALDSIRVRGWGPYIPEIGNLIAKEKFDIIHASIFPTTTSWLAFKAARRSGRPFVFTPYYHYLRNEFRDSVRLKEMLRYSDAIIACSKVEREKLIELGCEHEKLFVIPLAINAKAIPIRFLNRSLNRKQLGITGKSVILTYPWAEKGGNLVLRIAMRISSDIEGISLLTIGYPDNAYIELREKAKRTAPNLEIIDLGWVSGEKKWRAVSSADVFALPSQSDAFGMSYLDAWTSSLPVIVLRGTPQEEMVHDKVDGFVVGPDGKELEDVLRTLMLDHSICERLGNEGRRRVLEEFSPQKMISRYENVFQTVTSE